MQRPTHWWSLPGWWDELTYPTKSWFHRRFNIHLCVCLTVGHRWVWAGVGRYTVASRDLEVCARACCRGCGRHGQRWVERP
jgi:hypothetical protein